MERVPLLTFASLANVGGGAAVITTVAVAWTVMAFRAEDATIVQTFNDLGFFLYAWPPFGIWMVIIAIAILRDVNQKQTFPRWVALLQPVRGDSDGTGQPDGSVQNRSTRLPTGSLRSGSSLWISSSGWW